MSSIESVGIDAAPEPSAVLSAPSPSSVDASQGASQGGSDTDTNGVEAPLKARSNSLNAALDETGSRCGACVLIDVGGAPVTKQPSLQDAFARFRDQRKAERRLMKASYAPGTRTQEYRDQLRAKFLEQAKSYMGVPYHRRYREEGQPEAPLYLDCCGLVRQCLKDLKEEFGFVIGRWNQSYQMDVLPDTGVTDVSQLKPGDLIFYEGLYKSKRSKPQKHNNVHVEIFLGGETGEGTIGARFQRGVVSIFPSYKFESKSWDLVRVHYRSIEAWLDGQCKSYCPDHSWISESNALYAAAGRRSIFNDEDEDAGDESAGEDEEVGDDAAAAAAAEGGAEGAEIDSEGDESGGGDGDSETDSTEPPSVVEPTPNPVSSTAEPPGEAAPVLMSSGSTPVMPPRPLKSTTQSAKPLKTSDTSPLKISRALPVKRPQAGAVGASQESSTSTARSSSADRRLQKGKKDMINGSILPKTFYVHKSNGWRLVVDALTKRGWQQLPFEYGISTRFTLKWVERRSQIDYKAHVNGQLLNHIINNDCFTTKLGLLNSLRDCFCKPAVAASSAKQVAPLRRSADSSKPPINFSDLVATSSADGGLTDGSVRIPTPWLMESYQLDQRADCAAALKDDEDAMARASDSPLKPLWIFKPSFGNRGRGVHVVRGGRELKDLIGSYITHYHPHAAKSTAFSSITANLPEAGDGDSGDEGGGPNNAAGDDDSSPFGKNPKALVQRYIMDPLLVDGYKFDIRCYLLVARNEPHYLAFYHPGYCRFTLCPYSYDEATLTDPLVHLTNAAIQKKHPSYAERKENQIMTPEAVIARLEASGDNSSAEYMRRQLDEDIMACMLDVLKAAKLKLSKKRGYFDLYGFDFMIRDSRSAAADASAPSDFPRRRLHLRSDPHRRLVLIEVNTNPAMSLDNSVLANMLPGVIDSTLELVLASQLAEGGVECGVPRRTQYLTDLPGRFRLLADDAAGYEYTGESVSASAAVASQPVAAMAAAPDTVA